MTNNKKFLETVLRSCEVEGEKTWELPLVEDYHKKIESSIADLKNFPGDRWAGAIVAGLFLREFVDGTAWIHFDIAGPSGAWSRFNVVPYISTGGVGFGVRSMLHYLENNF